MRTVVLAAAALVLVSSAVAATPTVKATLTTSGPSVLVDQPWRYTLTVRSGAGAPLRARANLRLLVGGSAVACWQDGAMKQLLSPSACQWVTFRGKRTGTLTFPAQAVGVTLTFQAVVSAAGKTLRLRAPITVQPKP